MFFTRSDIITFIIFDTFSLSFYIWVFIRGILDHYLYYKLENCFIDKISQEISIKESSSSGKERIDIINISDVEDVIIYLDNSEDPDYWIDLLISSPNQPREKLTITDFSCNGQEVKYLYEQIREFIGLPFKSSYIFDYVLGNDNPVDGTNSAIACRLGGGFA